MSIIPESKIIMLGSSVRVSDPCYTPDTWCSLLISSVVPGQYVVKADHLDLDGWGRRVAYLTAIHVDHVENGHPWEDYRTIGVDSGQAGIFDESTYRDDSIVSNIITPKGDWMGLPYDEEPGDKWYDKMCAITINAEDQWGYYAQGVVSSSGLGDGMYIVQTMYDHDENIVGIRIDFGLAEDDLDEED
jgi:hypothetical protein